MKDRAVYAGLDRFRLIAALLVVTIHTSPLATMNGTADFILTRIVARVAVPFFFMASGFFLFRHGPDAKRLCVFLRKTALIYVIAVLLYVPLNFYNGSAQQWAHLPDLLRILFVDGTFYHLWYLPAAMLGAVIAWGLLRFVKPKGALIIGLFFYAIGLLGDSYYGFAEKIPAFRAFFQTMFVFSGYTRNGLFFAPVFFVLGAYIAKASWRPGPKAALAGLGISLVLMTAEGLWLHSIGVQRHDSMYVLLLPCMVFLFQSLLLWHGRAAEYLRNASAAVYILHPMMIVCVRGISDLTGLRGLLVDDSLVFFLAVTACSLLAAALLEIWRRVSMARKARHRRGRMDRAWAEINLENLCHNARVLRQLLPEKCDIMAVVKANAYGHGDIAVSKALNRMGIHAFAVATIDEGVHLRKNGVRGDILILGHTDPQRAATLCRYRLTQTVVDAGYAAAISRARRPIQVHIKVDTGMHRLGESCEHVREIAQMFHNKRLKVNGIFTHLCVSDSAETDDVNFSKRQIGAFFGLLDALKDDQIAIPKTHIQSSYGVLNHTEIQCDYARLGLALYGATSRNIPLDVGLRLVLSLRARVVMVRTITAGESVGYGRQFIAERDTRVAVLPIGYADGIPRSLGNRQGSVLLHGRRASIIGSICMDQLMADVTDIPNVTCGDVATLMGCDGTDEISAEEVALHAGTIANDILSGLSHRLERVFSAD